jgi:hypothetical protein
MGVLKSLAAPDEFAANCNCPRPIVPRLESHVDEFALTLGFDGSFWRNSLVGKLGNVPAAGSYNGGPGVGVTVGVGVGLGVGLGVDLGVGLGVGLAVCVGAAVRVGVAVGV